MLEADLDLSKSEYINKSTKIAEISNGQGKPENGQTNGHQNGSIGSKFLQYYVQFLKSKGFLNTVPTVVNPRSFCTTVSCGQIV